MEKIGITGFCITEKGVMSNHRKLDVMAIKEKSIIVKTLTGERLRLLRGEEMIKPNVTVRFDEKGIILMGQVYYELEQKDFANLVLLDYIKSDIESKLELMKSLLYQYESIDK